MDAIFLWCLETRQERYVGDILGMQLQCCTVGAERQSMNALEKWLRRPAVVVSVLGDVDGVVDSLRTANVDYVLVAIHPDEAETVRRISEVLGPVGVWNMGRRIVERIREGTTVVLSDFGNVSKSLQISLQEGIDRMNYDSKFGAREEWAAAGNLLLVNSCSESASKLLYSYMAPLYRRVVATVVLPPTLSSNTVAAK